MPVWRHGQSFTGLSPEPRSSITASLRDGAGEFTSAFVSDVVDQLDLRASNRSMRQRAGQPPYHPRMMTKILLSATA